MVGGMATTNPHGNSNLYNQSYNLMPTNACKCLVLYIQMFVTLGHLWEKI